MPEPFLPFDCVNDGLRRFGRSYGFEMTTLECGVVVVAALSFVAWFCACVRETVVSVMLYLCVCVGLFLAVLFLQVFTIGNPPCVWCRCCSYSVRFRIFLGTEFPWLVQKESESVPGFVMQMRLWTWIGLEWGVKRTACTFFGLG